MCLFVAPILASDRIGGKPYLQKAVRCVVGLSILFMPLMIGGDGFGLVVPWWAVVFFGDLNFSATFSAIAVLYFTAIGLVFAFVMKRRY